jgi:flagellar assembly protein FliH
MAGNKFIIKSAFPVRSVHLSTAAKTQRKADYSDEMLSRILEAETQKIRDEATITIEQNRQAAYDDGYATGAAEAEQKCLKEFTKSFQIIRKITDTYHHSVEELISREEQEMLRLIIAIARKVVDVEVQLDPDVVLSVLKNSLNLLNDRRSIRIHVHPQDWTAVKNSLAGLNLKVELPRDVEVVSSPSVSPGGCLVDSASGSIDADIDTQFDEIKRKLLKDES